MKPMQSIHYAVLADLVKSRAIEQRAQVQASLIDALDALNRRFADVLAAPLAMTAGDEFEGLFLSPAPLLPIAQTLSDRIAPHRLTFGFGAGTLVTPLTGPVEERQIGRLDGPVFHAARSALGAARRDDAWLAAQGFGAPCDLAVSGIGELLGELRWAWTDRRAEIVALARGRKQKLVAAELGVSQSVVSEALKAARYDVVLRNEARLQSLLEQSTQRLAAEIQPEE